MKFILISGLSGAGKSKAASFLEDMGYYVVDNMPAALIPKFAELCMAGQGQYDRVALVTDIRGGQTFDGLFSALDQLHEMGCDYKILFVEATLETIVKRYKETRRIHPLAKNGRSLAEAVRVERTALEPVRQRAEYIVDTSALSTAKLRGEMLRLFGEERLRDQQREGGVDMSGLFEGVVKMFLHKFPYGVTRRPHDHTASYRRVVRHFRDTDNVKIPL